MRAARVPYLTGHTIVRALGKEAVESAVVARLDDRSKPVPGSERQFSVDAVCLGFGFLPSTSWPTRAAARLNMCRLGGAMRPR